MNDKEIEPEKWPATREQLQGFHEFLMGKVPKGWNIKRKYMPKLTADQAFEVIYYLQEKLYVFPDNFELCHECHELHDSGDGILVDNLEDAHEMGYNVTRKDIGYHFCSNCR